ncbi:Holliday junction resolvase RecU [Bacillus carboniphilus]|uniref:Holliday junction resolvase RecU n=1 Tax=Bacillus carboniphilus TaxID=86663 RepID=A0ABY9JWC2_9BACI|nr:Holliday junction resolvase RecU [Bacillus carboniphilus]WLR43701.1 Holliday junction resolvase RecU [Bacillus carboniphilus]
MIFNYPNGKAYTNNSSLAKQPASNHRYSNRGMSLEEDINLTNQYYLQENIAVIHKKPTPVQIVDVHYPQRSRAVIKEAYFKQASTTDYNGVYKGKYIDFEAKETKNKTSFPLQNIHQHQINHMESVVNHNGIAFMIIQFTSLEEVYFLPAIEIFPFWERKLSGGRKSITIDEIRINATKIELGYHPRIDYIKVIKNMY